MSRVTLSLQKMQRVAESKLHLHSHLYRSDHYVAQILSSKLNGHWDHLRLDQAGLLPKPLR